MKDRTAARRYIQRQEVNSDRFIVEETPKLSPDKGDNETCYYELILDVKSSKMTNPVTKIQVSKAEIPYYAEESAPEKHPIIKRYLNIKRGDNLLVEYYSDLGISGYIQQPEIISLCKIETGLFKKGDLLERIRGIPLNWFYQEMIELASQQRIIFQATDTWMHSAEVYKLARDIADSSLADRVNKVENLKRQRLETYSGWILEKACYAHDVGRMFTGSAASRQIEDGALHGIYGALYFGDMENRVKDERLNCAKFWENPSERDVLRKFGRICERHIGGAGLTASSISTNKAFEKFKSWFGEKSEDRLAETFYEKVIGYADWRVHAFMDSTMFVPRIVSEHDAMKRTKGYNPPGDQVEAVERLCEYIHYITDNTIS